MARPKGTGRPTNLKLLAGERGNRRINRDEPQPEEGIPVCPSTDPRVVEIWDYTIRQLKVMKCISMGDRDMLHAYCQQVVYHDEAAKMLQDRGITLNTPKGPMKNPALTILHETALAMKQFALQFGLSPSARSSIKVADQTPAAEAGRSASRLLSS